MFLPKPISIYHENTENGTTTLYVKHENGIASQKSMSIFGKFVKVELQIGKRFRIVMTSHM